MDLSDQHDKGLALRKQLAGEASVRGRVEALGAFGAPLQHLINAYAYGDVWSRTNLPLKTKSLIMVGMMAAANRSTELKVHLTGAVRNGCTAEELQDALLLVAMYCGIPAANEAHRIAVDVLKEAGKLPQTA
jgi:4-carboxymuconolactone decarboxylase